MVPARRTRGLPNSPILDIAARCRRRRAFGEETIDLSVGQPDFATPDYVAAALRQAVAAGETRYAPLNGVGRFRVAVRRRLAEEGLRYRPREILVTAGATGGLWNAFQALVDPGEPVLIPMPGFPLYATQVKLAGGIPVALPTRLAEGFRLSPEALRSAARMGARLLVLNSPSNPTGAVYRPAELQALAQVVLECGLVVICDEVYRDFVYPPATFVSLAGVTPELRERCVLIRSCSKTYAMTGWRVGYTAAPAKLIGAMTEVQHAGLVGPTTPCQHAAAAALDGDSELRARLFRTFGRRARRVAGRLRRIPGVRLAEPQGAFFAFPDLSARCANVDALCRCLLDRSGVALVPGSAFGRPECARLSFAAPGEELAAGLDRLESALDEEPLARDGHAA